MPIFENRLLFFHIGKKCICAFTACHGRCLPDDLTGRQCFLIDPMLATGGTLVAATHYLAERGAKDVTAINIIAAPEGLKFVQEQIDPSIDFKVVVCAVDEKLNDKAYIVPGLGDAGDRLYGVID